MISLNRPQPLPSKYLQYAFASMVLWLAVISLFFSFASKSWLDSFFGLFILATPLFLYIYLSFNAVSFQINNNAVAINSGIVFKKSKVIPFHSVQTVNLNTGPIQGLFGISAVEIWTASQSQSEVHSGNTEKRADGILYLETKDAEQLREIMTKK